MPFRNVEFTTEDDIVLRGWWIPVTLRGNVLCVCVFVFFKAFYFAISQQTKTFEKKNKNTNETKGQESHRIAIIMHPYNNHKSNLLGVAAELWQNGYSVFMFDFRSFAQEKTRQSIGFHETKDAKAAIQYVLNHYYKEGESQLVLMGASMGGACALLASQYFPPSFYFFFFLWFCIPSFTHFFSELLVIQCPTFCFVLCVQP